MAEVLTNKADLMQLSITNTEGTETQDITQIINEIRYYESIFQPSITFAIDITDTLGLQQSLPILGGETVNLTFSHQFGDEDKYFIDQKLKIYKIDNVNQSNQARRSYTLYAMSDEFLKNERADMLVSAGYDNFSGKDIVEKIFQNKLQKIGNKDLVTKEETFGVLSLAFPSVSTFKAINMVCSQSESIKNKSSSFLFFENSMGYHFTTIENLFEQDVIEEFYDEVNTSTNEDKDTEIQNYQKIVSKNHVKHSNVLDASMNGKFANRVLYIDPIAKIMKSTGYNYSKDFKTGKHSDSSPVLSTKQSELFSKSPTTESFVPTNFVAAKMKMNIVSDKKLTNSPIRIQNFLSKEIAAKRQLEHQTINVGIPGNTEIGAGDVVMLHFKLNQTTDDGNISDPQSAGKWLVSSICHQINAEGEFITYLECMKDSYPETPKREVV